MPTISLTGKLEEEYQHLFDNCVIRQERAKSVAALLSKIEPSRNRYAAVGDPLEILWYFVGVIHSSEASLNWVLGAHLKYTSEQITNPGGCAPNV